MRKHYIFLFLILCLAWITPVLAATVAVDSLTTQTTPTVDDRVYCITGTIGAGTDRKCQIKGIGKAISERVDGTYNILDYGAACDGTYAESGAITASDNTLTAASGTFTADDVGKSIEVEGAGASGAGLLTTIASYTSATEVELTAAAGTTVSGKQIFFYDTDDTAGILAAYAAIPTTGGGRIQLPAGNVNCVVAGDNLVIEKDYVEVNIPQGTTLRLKGNVAANGGDAIQIGDYPNSAPSYVRVTGGGKIDGNRYNQKQGTAASDGANAAIAIETAQWVEIDHLHLTKADGYCLGAVGSNLTPRAYLYAHNLRLDYCAYDSFDIKTGWDTAWIENNWFYHNGYDGTISGRDGVALDARGDNLMIVGNYAEDNKSGNFRLRQLAGKRAVYMNNTSKAAPVGTYGFAAFGINTGSYQWINNKSIDDDTGMTIRYGQHNIYNFHAVNPTVRGALIISPGTDTLFTSATSNTVGTGTLTFTASSIAAVVPGQILRIHETGNTANYVQGEVTSVDGPNDEFDIDVTETGGSGTISTWTAYLAPTLEVNFYGGMIDGAGQDGIETADVPGKVTVKDMTITKAARYGLNIETTWVDIIGNKIINNGQTHAAKRGILFEDQSGVQTRVIANWIGDDQTTPTQQHAIRFDGTNSGNGLIAFNDFTGNSTGIISGTQPAWDLFRNNPDTNDGLGVIRARCLAAAPSSPSVGDIACDDGTDWGGSGAGNYEYNGSSWDKL